MQHGFVKGRQLTEAVLKLENAALQYTLVEPSFPAVLLLDQKAAFPSVYHHFLFFVLTNMMIPTFVVDALKMM